MVAAGPNADAESRIAALCAERDALARQLQESREREAMLSNELQHRVRNVMAVIRSIFSRTLETSESIDDVAMHFPGRLDALARYQAQSAALAVSQSFDLATMICDELVVFAAAGDPRVTINGPDVRLPQRHAATLGLALHELTANAVKFGALSDQQPRGRLGIAWGRAGDRVTLDWIETGVSVVAAAPAPIGFGRDYIEYGLPYQTGAATRFAILPGGVRCRIELAIE
jgi:two-component sensor histidine kinase